MHQLSLPRAWNASSLVGSLNSAMACEAGMAEEARREFLTCISMQYDKKTQGAFFFMVKCWLETGRFIHFIKPLMRMKDGRGKQTSMGRVWFVLLVIRKIMSLLYLSHKHDAPAHLYLAGYVVVQCSFSKPAVSRKSKWHMRSSP